MSADRPLPAHVRRDLDRAARGEGRSPTVAHPDCTCVGDDGHITSASRRECVQHGPERV